MGERQRKLCLISVFHTISAAIGVNAWFEFVASGANVSDLPSRGLIAELEAPPYSAAPFDVAWPDVAAWQGDLSSFFQSFNKRTGAQ